ncbi:MAG: B12-binding domain-containing protein [Anaerolineales bacterium]
MTEKKIKATFNLGAVIQETGIKPDTLRAWERRYGLPMPERTEGGQRLYSERDIKTIKWLLERQQEDIRIGGAVHLWNELIAVEEDPFIEYPLVETFQDQSFNHSQLNANNKEEILVHVRETWIDAVLGFHEEKAHQVLSDAFARFKLLDVFEEVLIQGLSDIGQGWFKGDISVQQEHFASNLAIQRLHGLVEASPPPIRRKVITVACPPREEHLLPSLLITLLLRRKGYPVINLGANVPFQDLEKSLQSTGSRLIIFPTQTLETAASLVPIVHSLVNSGYIVGFGGRIFSIFPALTSLIPGHFLGNKISELSDTIEQVLRIKTTGKGEEKPPSAEYEQLISQYKAIELKVWEDINQRASDIGLSKDQIHFANQHINMAILACLVFEGFEFLWGELIWLYGYLHNRQLSVDQLAAYFSLVENITADYLKDNQNLISKTIRAAREGSLVNGFSGKKHH